MRIVSMLLADAANQTHDNKVNLLGAGCDRLNCPQFPATGKLVVFMRIEVLSSEVGQHTVALNLINADGQAVIPPMLRQFETVPGAPMYSFLSLVYDLSFIVPMPGEYSFRAVIDGREESSCPLSAPPSSAPPLALPPTAA